MNLQKKIHSTPVPAKGEAMRFTDNMAVLHLKFKSGPAKDVQACLKLLKGILSLSNSYRNQLLTKNRVSKKANTTRHLRIWIDRLVNKANLRRETINRVITQIRLGRIEEIRTELSDEKISASATTDFEELQVKLTGKPVLP